MFKVGQVVWDLVDGKGVVTELDDQPQYPVKVKFDDGGTERYQDNGWRHEKDKVRSLYFSEPKIEAATEPVFEPALKKGDIVVYKNTYSNYYGVGEVEEEDEDSVSLVGDDSAMRKSAFDFYRLGEKINFK